MEEQINDCILNHCTHFNFNCLFYFLCECCLLISLCFVLIFLNHIYLQVVFFFLTIKTNVSKQVDGMTRIEVFTHLFLTSTRPIRVGCFAISKQDILVYSLSIEIATGESIVFEILKLNYLKGIFEEKNKVAYFQLMIYLILN